MSLKKPGILTLLASAFMLTPMSTHASVVNGDLLAVGGTASGWQECGSDNDIVDLSAVGNGGCAYQEFSVTPNTTYKLTCGVTSAKYASITLAFSDANFSTLIEDTVQIIGDETGSYSVTLTAPASAVSGAIGVYGEHGTNVQDCVVIDPNAAPTPTHGSIAGIAWFDENSDGNQDGSESIIANTGVELLQNGVVVSQLSTGNDGTYYFGQLDLDKTYTVRFTPLDSSLELTMLGGDSDADPDTSTTSGITLTATDPNATAIDAGFKPVPVTEPPSDYVICGYSWNDKDDNGMRGNNEAPLPYITVTLNDVDAGTSTQVTTGEDGSFVFPGLSGGNYSLQYELPAGYHYSQSAGAAIANKSFPSAESGATDTFNLPGAANGQGDSNCTLNNANVGLVEEPIAIEPTIAVDDSISALVGEQLDIDVTGNDDVCENTVSEVNILGHNVPGNVAVATPGNTVLVNQTTAAGDYSIQYGVRGTCGSYDEATVFVNLTEPVLDSTEMNYCRFRRYRQVLELWRARPDTTQAVLDAFVAPAMVVADGPLDLSGNMGWIEGSGPNTFENVSTIVPNPVQYGNHGNYYVFGAQWDYATQQAYPALRVVGSTNVVTIKNNDGSTYTKNCVTIGSPIALDLNRDNNVGRIAGTFQFDIDNNGELDSLSEWFSKEEGILFNASIDGEITGEHLFGNVPGKFENGYAKLAELDTNNDGSISGAELTPLAIWTDKNSNAVLDTGETSTLADHGIVSLSTEQVMYKSTATLTDGSKMLTEDLWFPLSGIDLARNQSNEHGRILKKRR